MEKLDLTESAATPADTRTQQYTVPPTAQRVVRRISRTGSVLLLLGLTLVSVGILLVAAEYYALISGQFATDFKLLDLYGAGTGILTAFGIVLVGTGWALDQRAVAWAAGPQRSRGPDSETIAGLVTFAVGVSLIAAWGVYSAYSALSSYYQIGLNPWKWTEVTLEVMLGIGVLLIAIGWFVHHLGVLGRMERESS